MNFLFLLFVSSAITSGLLLCVLKLRAQPAPRNQRRQSSDLDLTRLLRANRQEPLVDRQTEARVKPLLLRSLREHLQPNGHHQHERKNLP
jgi:hypothetical protein